MAQVRVDPKKIKSFRTAAELESWLSKHHDCEAELWLRFFKKDSGKPTVTFAEALEAVLCWCWIDGIRKAYDRISFLQRYSPRKPKSIWSHIRERRAPDSGGAHDAAWNLFALTFRTNNMKTPAGRAKKKRS